MTLQAVVVLGTGDHAAVVIDMARAAKLEVKGCVGPEAPAFNSSFAAHLGDDGILDTLDTTSVALTVGVGSVGDSSLRARLFETGKAKGFSFAQLTHPSAFIANEVTLGEGCQVMAGALIQPFAKIGRNAIVNTGSIIEHHAQVGEHAHIAPGAVVCGRAMVGEGAHIGANATVLQGVAVGARSVVGAGAVVARTVAGGSRVKGVPAR